MWSSPEFLGWNIEDRARAVGCPVLAIQGDRDEYGTLRQIEAVREAVQVRVLAGCGHAPHKERPQEVLAMMTGFVREVLDAAR